MSRAAVARFAVRMLASGVVIGAAACAGAPSAEPVRSTSTTASSPAGFTGELILTRQRDLLDRGLINVLTHNRSDASLLLSDIELVAERFEGRPGEPRTVSVRSGRQVAIQVPYGTAVDCEDERPVHAELVFTYTTADRSAPTAGRIELTGTGILDAIRNEQCTARRFDEVVRTQFEGTEIVDGRLVTDLVLEPLDTSVELTVTAMSGTVLVGVRTGENWTAAQLHRDLVRIPLTFVVNRCDPHALAEVTKRYGLQLAVSLEGAEPVEVDIDVDDLVDRLEVIVEHCIATAGD